MNLIAAVTLAAMTCVPVHIEQLQPGLYNVTTDAAGIAVACAGGPTPPPGMVIAGCAKSNAMGYSFFGVDPAFNPKAADNVCLPVEVKVKVEGPSDAA